MQTRKELRLLNKGVNADDSLQLLGEGQLINALNVTAHSPYTQQENSVRSLYAPSLVTAVNALLDANSGTNTLLNYYADNKSNNLFLFFYNSNNFHKIIGLNGTTATLHLTDAAVVGGLNWTADSYMSIDTFGDLLIFTDNINPIRYIDYTTTYAAASLTQRTLAFGQDGFAAPLDFTRFDDPTIYNFIVQRGGFQFCYRIQNTAGFTSVISPYSQTCPPVRQEDIDTLAYSGNTVDCSLNFEVTIPSNWGRVDFIVRNLADNSFFIFKSWYLTSSADVAAVAAHNAGTTALTSRYTGVNKEAIPANEIAQYFQFIPITSKFIDVNSNRLIAANNVFGYDTPTNQPPNLSLTTNIITSSNPSGTLHTVYLVVAKNFILDDRDFPIYAGLFVSFDSKVYSLPYEYSRFRLNGFTTLYCDTNNPFPYNPPQIISMEDLIEIPTAFDGTFAASFPNRFAYLDTLANGVNNGFNIDDGVYCYNLALAQLVWAVHKEGNLVDTTGVVTSGDWRAVTTVPTTNGYIGLSQFYMWDGNVRQVYVTDHPVAFASGENKAFLPKANYSYGIKYMDAALRSAGDESRGKFTIDNYDPINRKLWNRIDFVLSGAATGGAPEWAKHFAITMAKNDICKDFIMFAPNCIKVARQDDDGVIDIYSDWSNDFQSKKLYAIAVPLDSLGEYHKGYSYAEGDVINLSFAGAAGFPPASYTIPFEYTGSVIGLIDGHILIAPPSDEKLADITGVLSSQYKQIASPTYDATLMAAKSNFIQYNGFVYSRQHICYATLYIGQQKDYTNYEVGMVGYCEDLGSGNQLAGFYVGTGTSLTFSVYGDTFTQRRESRIGGFTGLSNTSNESAQSLVWYDNTGRLSPEDRVGQSELTNEVRWSNIGIPNAQRNNICVFDSADYKLMDISAGSINMIFSNFGDEARNTTLLVICAASGYAIPLGQSVIKSTQGVETVTQSDRFIDNINELTGRPATVSPRSFASHAGFVFWVDAAKRCVYQYIGGDVRKVSDFRVKRVFEALLRKAFDSGNTDVIGGINPLSKEYIIAIPNTTPTNRADLITTNIEEPFNYFYDQPYCWVFCFDEQNPNWSSIFQSGRWYMNINNNIYSWGAKIGVALDSMYNEYLVSDTDPEFDGIIAFGFNAEYPTVKSPLSLTLDASRAPDETFIYCDTNTREVGSVGAPIYMVAGVGNWIYREGQYQVDILRNRTANNAISPVDFDNAGISGPRIKGKVFQVVMKWNADGGEFSVTSCWLNYM